MAYNSLSIFENKSILPSHLFPQMFPCSKILIRTSLPNLHVTLGPNPYFGVKEYGLGPNAIQNSNIFPITMHVSYMNYNGKIDLHLLHFYFKILI